MLPQRGVTSAKVENVKVGQSNFTESLKTGNKKIVVFFNSWLQK